MLDSQVQVQSHTVFVGKELHSLMASTLLQGKSLHICHIVEAFGAGTLTAVSTLCRMVTENFTHTVLHSTREETPSDLTPFFASETCLILQKMQRELSLTGDMRALYGLIATLKQVKPDLVHCHSSKAGALGRIAAWYCGIPSVYTPHCYAFLRMDISAKQRFLYKAAEWACTRLGTMIAACGEEEYTMACALSKNTKRVRLIPNFLPLDELEAVVPYKWEQTKAIVGICARFSPQHVPELFFSVIEKLQDSCLGVWLGGDSHVSSFPPYVTTTPWLSREEVLARVAGFDIYLHTSLWEGLPYGVLEAMALGKPIVASNIPSLQAVVIPGVTGFLGNSPTELAQYAALLISDTALRQRMGEESKKLVATKYNSQKFAASYADIYHMCLSHSFM